MGKLDEAAPLWEESLKGRRQQLGDLHSDTLASINDLGVLFHSMGKLDEAAPLWEECFEGPPLKGRRQQLGDLHPDTLESINDLGVRISGGFLCFLTPWASWMKQLLSGRSL
eukprot:TRINITY_DN30091_c0_g1_i3.p2 TRINITY_DN30091_c0_g1~~TRINITY_DN30091_c0_g1_i3.p2  ORF type:complete len:112 (+),score=26.16 TRINITY_DN30091_c0_g1_i3:59-394(+)